MAEFKIASRKLSRTCVCCGRSFVKGDAYYRNRSVYVDRESDDGRDIVCANEWLECEACVMEARRLEGYRRYLREEGLCRHEDTIMHYSLISGEDYVQEPDYEECLICGAKV